MARCLDRHRLPIARVNHDELVFTGNRKIVHGFAIKAAQRQRGGWVRQPKHFRLTLQGSHWRLKHHCPSPAFRIHRNNQIGRPSARLISPEIMAVTAPGQCNALRRTKSSVRIAAQQIERLASALYCDHIPMTVCVEVSGSDEVRRFRQVECSCGGKKRRRRSVA